MKIPFPYIVIIFLVAVILLQRSCGNKCPAEKVVERHDTTFLHDKEYFPVHIPYPIEVVRSAKAFIVTKTDTEFITLETYVDTAKILADYFATRYYEDVQQTKFGNLTIKDSVTQNKIKTRQIFTDFTIPEIHSTSIVNELKRQLYVGFSLGSNGKALGAGPELLYKNKKDQIYSAGVSYIVGNNLYYHGSLYWKIKLK